MTPKVYGTICLAFGPHNVRSHTLRHSVAIPLLSSALPPERGGLEKPELFRGFVVRAEGFEPPTF